MNASLGIAHENNDSGFEICGADHINDSRNSRTMERRKLRKRRGLELVVGRKMNARRLVVEEGVVRAD